MIFKKYFFSCFSGRDSQKEKRLWNAVDDGDLATVRELIKTTFVDTTEGSTSGTYTPLLYAGNFFLFSSSHPDIKGKWSHILPHIS